MKKSVKTKKIAWNRRVNRPRVTRRIKKAPREAQIMERRMIVAAALVRTLTEKDLTIENLYNIFGVLHYADMPIMKTRMTKAMPLARKIIRMNDVADWTK